MAERPKYNQFGLLNKRKDVSDKAKAKTICKAKRNDIQSVKYSSMAEIKLLSASRLRKHSIGVDGFGLYFVDNLVQLKGTHSLAVFNDYMIMDYIDEFCRRFYSIKESTERIPKFAVYYKNYLAFFCKSTFVNMKVNALIQVYSEAKAEVYYNNNHEKKDNEEDSSEKDHIHSKNFAKSEKMKEIFTQTLKHELEAKSSFDESSIKSMHDFSKEGDKSVMKTEMLHESILSILDSFKQPVAIQGHHVNRVCQRKQPQTSTRAKTQFINEGLSALKKIKSISPNRNIQITSYKSFNHKTQSVTASNKPIKLTNGKTSITTSYPSSHLLHQAGMRNHKHGKSIGYLTMTKALSTLRQSTQAKGNEKQPNTPKRINVNDVMKMTLQLQSPSIKGFKERSSQITHTHHHTISSPTINNFNININTHICLREPKSPKVIHYKQSPKNTTNRLQKNHLQSEPKGKHFNVKLKSKPINSRNKPQSLTKSSNSNNGVGTSNKVFSSFTVFDLQQQLLNSKAKFNSKQTTESKKSDDKLFILHHESTNKTHSHMARPLNNKQSASLTTRKPLKIAKIIKFIKK